MIRGPVLTLLLALPAAAQGPLATGPGPALPPGGFRHLRDLAPSPPGPALLVLDAPVLAGSPRLEDLRLLDGRDRQVPYLLEGPEGRLDLDLPLATPVRAGRESRHRLTLPALGRTPALLRLEAAGGPFRRDLRIEAGPSSWQGAWVQTADGPGTLEVDLGPLAGPDLLLVVDEGDNPPLALTAARLRLPRWRLRFVHPGGALRLAYGADLEAPRYDLALQADRLRALPAGTVDLAPAGPSRPERSQAILFWGALAGAAAVLLLLLGRLLRRPAPPPAP